MAPRRRAQKLGRFVALGVALSAVVVGVLAPSGLAAPLHETNPKVPQQVVLHNGAAALKQTPRGGQVRWNRRETTVHIDASVDRLGPSTRDAIRNAFGTWLESDAKLPRLTFDSTDGTKTALKPDGKNSVLYAPITVPGHENDLAITLTYSDETSGNVLEADIVINANYDFRNLDASAEDQGHDHDHDEWNGGDDDSKDKHAGTSGTDRGEQRSSCVAPGVSSACRQEVYDIQNVVTHEVGHFFGLGEDMDDTAATMYVCTNRCETHKRVLSEIDKATMSTLYATADTGDEPEAPPGGCGGARLATTGNMGEAAWALLAGLALLARRKRAR